MSRKVDWALLFVVIGCAVFILTGTSALAATPKVAPRYNIVLVARDIHVAAQLGVRNRPVVGLKILERMNPDLMNANGRDLWHLTMARLLVQIHDLKGAIAQYNFIKNSSPFWLDALEEKGEVTARTGQYANALAILQTALAPQFKNKVDPHTFFVASLTHLRICDYAGVFIVSKQFKKNIDVRLPKWRIEAARGNWHARHMIAATERTLHQLQIIEADTIQRMALAKKAANGTKIGHITDNEDVLVFPVSRSPRPEVWRDELGHYEALMRTCHAPKGEDATRVAANTRQGNKI